jgi:hypothetical protein
MLVILLATASSLAAPALVSQDLHVCGAHDEGHATLSVQAAPTTLQALAEGWTLGEGTRGDLPVGVVSAGAASPEDWRQIAEQTASALDYRVGRREIHARRKAEPVSASQAAVLLRPGGEGQVWLGEDVSLEPLLALAAERGLLPAPADETAILPSPPAGDSPMGQLLGPALAGETGEAGLWMVSLSVLCDQLAGQTGRLLLMERELELGLTLWAMGPVSAAAMLDLLEAAAPVGGFELQKTERVAMLRAQPGAERPAALIALFFPGMTGLGEWMDAAPEGTTFREVAGGTLLMTVMAQSMPMTSGASDPARHEELRAQIAERRRLREGDPRFVREGDTVTFPREAVSRLASEPLEGLTPARGPDGALQGYEVTFRTDSELRWLGLASGDVLLRWDGGALQSAEALQALVQALLTRERVSVVVRRREGEVALTWLVQGEPLEGLPPAPAAYLGLAELRLQAGITASAGAVRLRRQALAGLAEDGWGGRFLVSHAGVRWKPSGVGGLGLLLGDRTLGLTSLREPSDVEALVEALLSQPSVALQTDDGPLTITLDGPPLPRPAGWGTLPIDLARVTAAERCQMAELLPKAGRYLLHRGVDGAFDGYRVSAIRTGSLLARLGLNNGDVLMAMDGEPIYESGGAELLTGAFFTALTSPGPHTMEVMRRGEQVEVAMDVLDGPCGD